MRPLKRDRGESINWDRSSNRSRSKTSQASSTLWASTKDLSSERRDLAVVGTWVPQRRVWRALWERWRMHDRRGGKKTPIEKWGSLY